MSRLGFIKSRGLNFPGKREKFMNFPGSREFPGNFQKFEKAIICLFYREISINTGNLIEIMVKFTKNLSFFQAHDK